MVLVHLVDNEIVSFGSHLPFVFNLYLISQFYESDNHRLKNRIHVLEGDLFARDRMVNDLRMRIPEGTTANDVKIIKTQVDLVITSL